MVKLIAIDMDGTLLNHEGQVSTANLQAIEMAQAKGVVVAIATGRSHHGARKVLDEIGFGGPLIYLNGSCTQLPSGELVEEIFLPRAKIDELMPLFKEGGTYYEFYTRDGIYRNRDGIEIIKKEMEEIEDANPLIHRWLESFTERRQHRIEDRVEGRYAEDILADPSIGIYKSMVLSTDLHKLKRIRARVEAQADVAVASSSTYNFEVNHPEAQKGIAVKKLANRLDIPMEEVMVIGDNQNDLSMMRMAGISVAMGNAEDEIKEACRFVTKTNEEDGVAFAIQKFVGE
ncbi:Cof-type HAD-IIB family hydrolase [Laceyella putida]|uniref:Cof-type HAD-IIB family hydrolase n=1 Tax=Laceyella putida TaxID=110101 RepID=A0ABW2RLG9_9BACL